MSRSLITKSAAAVAALASATTLAVVVSNVAAASNVRDDQKPTVAARGNHHDPKPTIVLVHGAFADSSSWNGVTRRLLEDGYPVIAAANPLRGVASDAAAVASVLHSIKGPVILVGHSYGGNVITTAAVGDPDVKALVYVAGFAPDTGESAAGLSGKFPGSTLGPTLEKVPTSDGGVDLYVKQKLFRHQFAADVNASDAALMAVTQRPIAASALSELSGKPAWRKVPSYHLIPGADLNIPPAVQTWMARRDHATILNVKGASHAVLVSKPIVTAKLIERAAAERG